MMGPAPLKSQMEREADLRVTTFGNATHIYRGPSVSQDVLICSLLMHQIKFCNGYLLQHNKPFQNEVLKTTAVYLEQASVRKQLAGLSKAALLCSTGLVTLATLAMHLRPAASQLASQLCSEGWQAVLWNNRGNQPTHPSSSSRHPGWPGLSFMATGQDSKREKAEVCRVFRGLDLGLAHPLFCSLLLATVTEQARFKGWRLGSDS